MVTFALFRLQATELPTFLHSHGGPGGSRNRVRNLSINSIYVCIPLFVYRLNGKRLSTGAQLRSQRIFILLFNCSDRSTSDLEFNVFQNIGAPSFLAPSTTWFYVPRNKGNLILLPNHHPTSHFIVIGSNRLKIGFAIKQPYPFQQLIRRLIFNRFFNWPFD